MAKSAKANGAGRTRDERAPALAEDKWRADFDERLKRAQGQPTPAPDAKARGSAMGVAFRIASELIAGLIVGGLIGWQLDRWLDTSPVLLLVFFLLGAAAGIWNVIRTALAMQADAQNAESASKDQDVEPGSD